MSDSAWIEFLNTKPDMTYESFLEMKLLGAEAENAALKAELDERDAAYSVCDCCECLTSDPVDAGDHVQCQSCTRLAKAAVVSGSLQSDIARHVEIAAQQAAEIEALRARVWELETAARIGGRWMEFWLDQELCDCDFESGGHRCGYQDREHDLAKIKAALQEPQG